MLNDGKGLISLRYFIFDFEVQINIDHKFVSSETK